MATTGIVNGRNWELLWNGTQITHLTSVSLDLATETIDMTSYDSANWKEIDTGDKSWSINFEAFVAFDAAENVDEVLSVDWLGDASGTALLSTQETGDTTFSGTGYITTGGVSGDLGSKVKMTGTITGTGALTVGTVA